MDHSIPEKLSTFTMAAFSRFHSYTLHDVTVTNHILGHGSYATVVELEYNGQKCAGKKIHDILLSQGTVSYPVLNFERECHLLSELHHPNIVEFLGVFFEDPSRAPILVMEYLSTDLTLCIKEHGILPDEINYSILYDVAKGLDFLHNQHPPVIHRDLTCNNVLLTSDMAAKISDLGVAKLVNLPPLQVSRMTQTPGTPAYMPPEVMISNPMYDVSIDEFSYGILIIHVLSGLWPEPHVESIRVEADKLIPVSEAERRRNFLEIIGDDHPLMQLVLSCVNNNPQQRPHSGEILNQLAGMVKLFPSSRLNTSELDKFTFPGSVDKDTTEKEDIDQTQNSTQCHIKEGKNCEPELDSVEEEAMSFDKHFSKAKSFFTRKPKVRTYS